MAQRIQVYLSAPLFSIHERRANRELAERVRELLPGVDILLPQDFKPQGRYNDARGFGQIFLGCVRGIEAASVVVAFLDGPDSDSGTSWECGYAYARGKPVVGVRTDYRPGQAKGLNLMLAHGAAAIVRRPSFDEDLESLARDIALALKRVLRQGGQAGPRKAKP